LLENKKLWFVFSAFLIAVFLIGIVNLFLLRFEAGDFYPPYSSLRSDPLGTRALYESLDNLDNIAAKRNYLPMSKIKSGQGVTLFYLGAKIFNSDSVSKDLLKSFEHISRSGGRLVIAFFPTMKNQLKPLSKEKASENSKENNLRDKKDNFLAKEDQFVSLAERWGVSIRCDEIKEINKKNAFKAESSIQGLRTPVFLHTAKYFDDLSDSWEVIYASDDRPAIIERKFGKGTIVLSSDSYFFSNEALRAQRYPELLAHFMGSNSKAFFDETHFGINKSFGVVYFVRKYRFHWFAAGIVLLAILFVWKNSVCFVPPNNNVYEGNEESVFSDKDYTQGLISLLRRNIPKEKILKVCVEEWEKSIHQGGLVNHDKLELIKGVVERKETKTKKDYDPVKGYKTINDILSSEIVK
jgi:hypothetical protein